ncbi:MAG: hypothetical protein H0T41_07805 [Rhodobacteraceae bacterium]|nr:hypothetical protein [Paracoccaceae bacterium]
MNGVAFLASVALVLSARVPTPEPAVVAEGPMRRIGFGIRAYLATPRLRVLLALSLAVAAGGAMVIVNSVVIVRGTFGLGDREVAPALAAQTS